MNTAPKTILVTGAAGFIGFHVATRLLKDGHSVIGLDQVNDYYDPKLKLKRLELLQSERGFTFHREDVADQGAVKRIFDQHEIGTIIHLAAQAGVRYSLDQPHRYIDSNVTGFLNLLEAARHHPIDHFIYASSSSVYGANEKLPYSTTDSVDQPISLYAATKKANELMAHTYSHLFQIPVTGLRFFTVYGPWGRPDMAYYKFVGSILAGQPIQVFNHGRMQRDFTYIDDIVEGVVRLIPLAPKRQEDTSRLSQARSQIYNIGNHQPVGLLDFITCIEEALGRKAVLDLQPMQPGDVQSTYADIDDLREATGFSPSTPLKEGIRKFVDWYLKYHAYAGEVSRS